MMRAILLVSALAFGLAPSAFAQTHASGTSSSGDQAATTSPQAAEQASQTSSEQQSGAAASEQIVQRLQSDLQQKGYQDVKVVPESFMITATKDGQPVLMLLSPGSVTSVVMGKTGPLSSTAQAPSSATNSMIGDDTGSSGSQDRSSQKTNH